MHKCASDGLVLNLEFPEPKHATDNLRVFGKRFTEIAKRVNATDRIYPEDISEMKSMFQATLEDQKRILAKLEDT